MQVCYTAVLTWCGNQFTAGLIGVRAACEGREHSRCVYRAVHAICVPQGWKQKLAVLERFQLADLTAFGLWAAFSRARESGICRQCAAPSAGDVPSLPQLAIAEGVPNLNPGLVILRLHHSTALRVHQQVSILGDKRKTLQVYFVPVIRQRRVGTHCPATYVQSEAFLYIYFFNLLNIASFILFGLHLLSRTYFKSF